MNLCKNVFGVFASPLLRLVSELQVSRRCWRLVAGDAWCVRWRERMQCCLVHEKSWNNLGVGEIRSHVFVPDFDYATRNRKLVTFMRTCPSASGVVSICWWLDFGLSRVVWRISECECLSLLSAFEGDVARFFSIFCILTPSRIVRGPVVCSAHECSQLSRWLL